MTKHDKRMLCRRTCWQITHKFINARAWKEKRQDGWLSGYYRHGLKHLILLKLFWISSDAIGKPLQRVALQSRAQLWGRDSFHMCLFFLLFDISPLQISNLSKNILPPPAWAAPVSQLCATLNKSSRYNTTSPSPGRGSPGPGMARGRIARSLSCKPLGPTPTGNQLHPSPALSLYKIETPRYLYCCTYMAPPALYKIKTPNLEPAQCTSKSV